jgi:hypothetical protein
MNPYTHTQLFLFYSMEKAPLRQGRVNTQLHAKLFQLHGRSHNGNVGLLVWIARDNFGVRKKGSQIIYAYI